MKKNDLGLVHIYCGEGKGKTTCSVGLTVRACGYGLCPDLNGGRPDDRELSAALIIFLVPYAYFFGRMPY